MPAEPTQETLYLVDGFALIFQNFFALNRGKLDEGMTSPTGAPTSAIYGFTRDMMFLRDTVAPTHLVCVFDPPGKTFRDAIFPEYKAQRSPTPDDLISQIPVIRDELLPAMRIPVVEVANFEADDVLATLARAGEARGMQVFICTSDKDCRQLLTDRIKVYNLRKRELYDAVSLHNDWGVRPDQVVDFQTLVGDSVDNIPGAKGIGEKTAAKLLQDYGTLDNLVAKLDEIPGKKKDNLRDFLPMLDLTRTLVKLDTQVPFEQAWDRWHLQEPDAPRLHGLFKQWGFRRFADQVAPRVVQPAKPTGEFLQGDLFGGEATSHGPPRDPNWQATYHLVNAPQGFADFLVQLQQQKRFAVDLETTSLDAHEADIVGMAFCWKAGEAWYLALRGPAGETTLDPAKTLAALKPILEDANIGKINQNIKYDWQVLLRHEVQLAGVVGDSMIAGFLLDPGARSLGMDELSRDHLQHRPIPIRELIGKGKKQIRMDQVPTAQVAEYAAEDADVAWRLCDLLEPRLQALHFRRSKDSANDGFHLYDDLEIPLIEVLAHLEFTGVRLDVPFLNRMAVDLDAQLQTIEQTLYDLAGKQFNIGSLKQLRDILFKEMGFKPEKRTALTSEASTDQETLESLATQESHPHVEFPRQLLEQRKIAKLKSTYVDALPLLVSKRTGRVHTKLNQASASTGRLSSSEPNLQNIPSRTELGGQIRRAFLPQEGWLLLAADYSQVELRMLAHFSRDEQLQQAFTDDQDIHQLVASQIFNVASSAVDRSMRRIAKTVNFGVIYGMSAFGLAQRLEMKQEDANTFIDAYFARYPRVLEYQDQLLRDCIRDGYVSTILGRRRAIVGVRGSSTYKSRNQPEREAINMPIQGSAADLIKVAMLNLHRRLKREQHRSRMLMQIHDELVFEVPPDERDAMVAMVREEMASALAERISVRLAVDIGVGPNWLDTTDA